jgi:hypothetical protein
MPEPVEELFVRITADAAEVLDHYEAAMEGIEKKTVATFEDMKEAAKQFLDSFDAQSATVESFGALVARFGDRFNLSFKDAIQVISEELPNGLESVRDELVRVVESTESIPEAFKKAQEAIDETLEKIEEGIDKNVVQAHQQAVDALEAQGVQVTEVMKAVLGGWIQKIGEASSSSADFWERMESAFPALLQEARIQDEIAKSLTKVSEAYKEAGKALPVEEFDRLQKKMQAVAETLQAGGTTMNSAVANVRQLGDQAAATAQSQDKANEGSRNWEQGLRRLATRLLATVGLLQIAQRVFRAFISFLKESVAEYLKAADAQSTFVLQMREIETQSDRTKQVTGAFLVQFAVWWDRIKVTAQQVIAILVSQLPKVLQTMKPLIQFWFGWNRLVEQVKENIITMFRDVGAVIRAVIDKDWDALDAAIKDALSIEDFGDPFAAFEEGVSKAGEFVDELAGTIQSNFEDALRGLGSEAEVSGRRLLEQLTKLEKEIAERGSDIMANFNEQMAELGEDFNDRWSELHSDLASDLSDIDAEAQESSVKATQDYNQSLFRLEEDHKLRMLELEENYLLSLEDSVRERDARQVLLLQRRHNLEKTQEDRQKNLRGRRLKQDFQLELAEIQRQREIRRVERLLEFTQEKAELQKWYEERRIDLQSDRDKQLYELDRWKNKELKKIAEAESAKLNLTAEAQEHLYEMLNTAFGSDGWAIAFIENYANQWSQLMSQVAAGPSGVNPYAAGGYSPYSGGVGHQRGGTVFATSPQLIKVGEIPERVDITPLSSGSGLPKAGFQQGGGEMDIRLRIGLDSGLVAEIVDQSMDSVANVLVNIERNERRGK